MELLILLGILVALGILAVRYGADSRDNEPERPNW